MGNIVDALLALEGLDLERRDMHAGAFASVEEIAQALGGEADADGRKVRCPAPGCGAEDRSLVLRIDPAAPNSFFIYATEGSEGRAYRHVREKLKLVSVPAASANQRKFWALDIWDKTRAAPGTVVETYLRSRAIVLPVPDRLRFYPDLQHKSELGESTHPAMVACVTDVDDKPFAVHRTWLRRDGAGKADVEPCRKTLGPMKDRGGAVRLAPAARELAVAEGIETSLSVMQATGLPTWAALSTYGLKTLALPRLVESVAIFADGDDEGETAALFAARRWKLEGRQVRIVRPPRGFDFNDVLAGRAPHD